MDLWAAAVVWGVAGLLLLTTAITGRMRARYKILAPAMTGHPMFERAYRVQMNTLEQTLMFLPVFLLAAHFGRTDLACIFGGVWLLGRLAYIVTYLRAPRSRGPAFGVAMLAFFALMAQSAWHIAVQLVTG